MHLTCVPHLCSHKTIVMAFSHLLKGNFRIIILISIAMFCCNSGAAEDELQGQSITKALSCFDNKLIYVGCNQAYRLNPSGNINIPPEATDFFCSGPCLTETQLMLNCIDRILSNFIFYNKATLSQMRYAVNAGCSYTKQRGNFNLGEYLEGETSNACKLPNLNSFYLFMIVAAAVNLM